MLRLKMDKNDQDNKYLSLLYFKVYLYQSMVYKNNSSNKKVGFLAFIVRN